MSNTSKGQEVIIILHTCTFAPMQVKKKRFITPDGGGLCQNGYIDIVAKLLASMRKQNIHKHKDFQCISTTD